MDVREKLGFIFEPALVDEMMAYGELREFAEGELIMDYGKYVKSLPIVLKGTIKVLKMEENGKELLLYYLTTSDSCSMAYNCCMEARKSEIRAITEEPTLLISIPHQKLDEWLCKYQTWKSYIMKSFNERFIELLKTIENIAFKKLDERLIQYLKDKSELADSSLIKATHNQIADDLATSRVVISRLLKQLENDKYLLLYRNEIKLLKAFYEDYA